MFEAIGTAVEYLAYGVVLLALVAGALLVWKVKCTLFPGKKE